MSIKRKQQYVLSVIIRRFGNKNFRVCELMQYLDSSIYGVHTLKTLEGLGFVTGFQDEFKLSNKGVNHVKQRN